MLEAIPGQPGMGVEVVSANMKARALVPHVYADSAALFALDISAVEFIGSEAGCAGFAELRRHYQSSPRSTAAVVMLDFTLLSLIFRP
jgi:hypothetical protein